MENFKMYAKKQVKTSKFNGRFVQALIRQVRKEYPETMPIKAKEGNTNTLSQMVYFELTNGYFEIKDNEIHLTRYDGILPIENMPEIIYNWGTLPRYPVIELRDYGNNALLKSFNGGQFKAPIFKGCSIADVEFNLEMGCKVWAYVDKFNHYNIVHFEIEDIQHSTHEIVGITEFPG